MEFLILPCFRPTLPDRWPIYKVRIDIKYQFVSNYFGSLLTDDSYTVLQQNNNCEKCISYAISWTKLMDHRLARNSDIFLAKSKNSKYSETSDSARNPSAEVFNCVADVFAFLDNECVTNKESIDVLVTGSLYLVGATLAAIHAKQ